MNTPAPVPAPSRDPNAPPSPFSEKLHPLLDALECLYIRGNTSGRRLFCESWPQAVPYVFDETLIRFDTEGVHSDAEREQRPALEIKAEERRDELIPFLETLETKSINDGMLQVDFVRDIMTRFRRDFLLCLYAEHIVNKFVPAPPAPGEAQAASPPPAPEDAKGAV